MDTSKVNINELIDKARFTSFHWKVLIWCLLIIIFDGYDLVIYGVALPLLMQQWSLTAVEAGFTRQCRSIRHDVWCHDFRHTFRQTWT